MAPTRSLNVVIAGDPRSLGVASKKSIGHIEGVEKSGKRMGKALALGFAAAGAAAAGALVVGLKKSVDAAVDAEKSQAKLKAQLEASGASYRAHAKEIDAVIQKHSKLAGVDDEDLQDAFSGLVRTTGSVSKAMKDMGLVTDIMRGKNVDAATAGALLSKVHNGNVTALKKMGIAIDPVTKAQDELKASNKDATKAQVDAAKAADKAATAQAGIAELQKRFGGQAAAYGKTAAGAQDRFRVAIENLQEKLGAKLLPVITDVTNKVATFIGQMESGKGAGGRFAEVIGGAFEKVKAVADAVWPVLREAGQVTLGLLGDGFGRLKAIIEAATPTFLQIKDAAVIAFTAISGWITENRPQIEAFAGAVKDKLSSAFGTVRDTVSTVVAWLRANVPPAFEAVKGAVVTAFDAVKGAVSSAVQFVKGWIDRHRDDIHAFGEAWRNIAIGVGTAIGAVVVAVKTVLVPVMQVLWDVVKAVWPGIKKTVEGALDAIGGLIQVFSGVFTGDFGRIWDGVKGIFRGAIKAVLGILGGLAAAAGTILRAAGGLMKDAIIAGLKGLAKLIWAFIKEAIGFVINGDRVANVAIGVGKAIGPGIIKGLGNLGHLILDKVKDALGFVVDNVPGLGLATSIGKGIANKITGGAGDGVGHLPLPSGTFGGGLKGARPSLAPFASAASRFGLGVSSGLRAGSITSSGNKSYHSTGEAIDLAGNPQGMLAFFRQAKAKWGGRLAELIHTPGGAGIKDGKPYTYGGKVAADHFDHVHLAFDSGVPGVGDGIGRAARTGDGPGRIFNWAKGHGFSDEQAAGWVGNISQESGFNSAIKQPNGPGRGLAQWGGSRFTSLQSFAAKRKKPWTDFNTQLDFMWSELQGPESGAYSAIKGAKSLEAATSAIATRYERAGTIGDRLGPARAALKRFAKGGPGTSKSPGSKSGSAGSSGGGYSSAKDAPDSPTYAGEGTNDPLGTSGGGLLGRVIDARRPGKGGPSKGYPIGFTPAAPVDAPAGPTLDDFALARVARAKLTEGTDDDISALENLLQLRQQQMDAALADSDPRNDAEAIDAFLSVKDALKELTDATAANTAALDAQRLQFQTLIAQDYQRQFNVSQSQYGILAQALSDVVNGGIGQRLGLGLSGMRAAPGSVARA